MSNAEPRSAGDALLSYGIINQIPSRQACIANDELIESIRRRTRRKTRRRISSCNKSSPAVATNPNPGHDLRLSFRSKMTRVLGLTTPLIAATGYKGRRTSLQDPVTFSVDQEEDFEQEGEEEEDQEEKEQETLSNDGNSTFLEHEEISDDVVLYEIFRTFCIPAPTLHQINRILQKTSFGLPPNVVISMGEGGAPVCRLLCCLSENKLFSVPNDFLVVFFHILTRLLSNASADDYLSHLSLKMAVNASAAPQDALNPQHEEDDRRNRDSLIPCMDANFDSCKDPLISNICMPRLHTHVSFFNVVRMRCANEWMRFSRTSGGIVEPKNGAVVSVINSLQLILSMDENSCLIPPLCWLLSLLVIAGISPRELRQLSDLISMTSSVARFHLLRVLQYAALAADSMPPFFTFDSTSGDTKTTGLSINKMKPLFPWPFRNDFGFAVWIRVERFDGSIGNKSNPTLLFVQSDCGFGIHVSLDVFSASEADGTLSEGATVTVRVTSNTAPKNQADDLPSPYTKVLDEVRILGCTLFPRIWYHVALRHSSPGGSMKGYFTSAKDEISFFLNGKLVLTQDLVFPKITTTTAIASSSSTNPRNGGNKHGIGLADLHFADNFSGETGTLYVFNEYISDTVIQGLYERTLSGYHYNGSSKDIGSLNDSEWNSARGELARKSNLIPGDAEVDELLRVCSVVSSSANRDSCHSQWLDVVESGDQQNDESRQQELSTTNFASKVCIAWDPSRKNGQVALEIHMGAHVLLNSNVVHTWEVVSAKKAVVSIGGIPALLLLFQQLLEQPCEAKDQVIKNKMKECLMIPNILLLLAAFIRDNTENCRALLLCRGVDILEYWIEQRKKHVEMKAIRTSRMLSRYLIRCLIDLFSAASCHYGLEAKVFSRLIVNIQLWFGGGASEFFSVPLLMEVFSFLSCVTKHHPNRMSDSVDVKDMIQFINDLTTIDEGSTNSEAIPCRAFDPSYTAVDFTDRTICLVERRHLIDVILGILVKTMTVKSTRLQLVPIVNYISFTLDAEFEMASQQKKKKHTDENQSKADSQREKCIASSKLCTMILHLLEMRPVIPGLFESFELCFGSPDGTASWILCCMVNSFDEFIRAIGIRTLTAYIDGLFLTSSKSSFIDAFSFVDSSSAPVKASLLKSVTKIRALNAGEYVLRMNIPVIHKLLWHLLKCHRDRLGGKTHAALVNMLVAHDRNKNSESISTIPVIKDDALQGGYKFDCNFAKENEQLGIDSEQRLRSTFALNTILRLLRFLHPDAIERWLFDLLTLVRISPDTLTAFLPSSEWQPCLFFLLSEIVEEISRQKSKHPNEEVVETMPNSGYLLASGKSDVVSLDASIETFLDSEDCSDAVKLISSSPVMTRYDLCTKLFASLLGTCVRRGEKCYQSVEIVASLQRVCVNGHEIFGITLSHLLNDLTESGTVENANTIKINDTASERSRALKQSALVVTNAILSNGTNEMDLSTAVKHWRCLRHLASLTVAFITASGYGVVNLFDYRYEDASALECMTGGLHGIRLRDGILLGVKATDILKGFKKFESGVSYDEQIRLQQRSGYRIMCVTLAAQMLALLDAFIFPDSLDTSLPASQLHGLALVRSNEPRLGLAQGPLLLSLIRLSLVLLSYLEPSSVKFLQCCGRLRCLLHWLLELIRESIAGGGFSVAFSELTSPLDRLVLVIVLQCHRALKKCSNVLIEIEVSSPQKYFANEEMKSKNYRRLFRSAFELREIVLAAFRGRNEVLRVALSLQAYEALHSSFEELVCAMAPLSDFSLASRSQKESSLRIFLTSSWVQEFSDINITDDIAIPEQVSDGQVFRNKTSSHWGRKAVFELLHESNMIVKEYYDSLDKPFESYCEDQRQWAETDAVRDLEYEGDVSIRNLSQAYLTTVAQSMGKRYDLAGSKWKEVVKGIPALRWSWIRGKYSGNLETTYWKIAKTVDSLHRRLILTPNKCFNSHSEASYENMLGRERERERERSIKAKQVIEQQRLAESMLKNASDAFFKVQEIDETDDVDEFAVHEGDEIGEGRQTEGVSPEKSVEDQPPVEFSTGESALNSSSHSISWAKTFVWEPEEKVVQLFKPVLIVSLQTLQEGQLLLTSHSIYFHATSDDISAITKEKVPEGSKRWKDRRWRLASLIEVHGRRYVLRPSALELFFADSREVFFSFEGSLSGRDSFFDKLKSCKVPLLKVPKSLNPRYVFRRSKITDLWRKRRISNFQYLMQLNMMAGRTFNDINQYPVFPWVLSNYTSETLDLTDPSNFRDLTKPVGALNPERLRFLLERFQDLDGFKEEEKFLYGSHYSSPGTVLYYLIRQEPFTSMHIELQSGRFDVPDRLFHDISGCWKCCLKLTSDVKELIPEFFTCPEIFLNMNNFPLGSRQDGALVSDVILPPWANGSAYEFVRKHALALESEYVSQNLNHWIDLIFGFKQRGPAAAAANNVFHFLSYEGSVDLDSITNRVDREATESHIQNFGQTPSQLILKDPHPVRYTIADTWSPIISDSTNCRLLRCWTPSKQFGLSDSCGAVMSIHILTEQIVVVYADMSVGSYRWYHKGPGSAPFLFKPDKLRSLGTRTFSLSPTAVSGSSSIKDRAAASNYRSRVIAKQLEHSHETSDVIIPIQSSFFGVTVGGYLKENLRKSVSAGSRSIEGSASLDSSYYFVSCGYWDGTVKIHTLDGLRLKCSATGGHRGPIVCLSIGECGGMMVTGGLDATCRIWIVDHPNLSLALADARARTSYGYVAEVSQERLLRCCHVLWGHITPISAVAISSDLDIVVSGSVDGMICVHLARKGKFLRSINVNDSTSHDTQNLKKAVRKLVLHSQGFVAHTEDKMLHSCTINGVILSSVSAEDRLHAMVVSSDGQMLITGGDKFAVVIRAISTLSVHSVLDLSKHGPIRCIALTPAEYNPAPQFIYIGTNDGLVTIVDSEHEHKS